MRYKNLTDIPTKKHPFNLDRYHRLLNEVESAMRGFEELKHAGNPEAAQIADLLSATYTNIGNVWNAVVEAEHRERMTP